MAASDDIPTPDQAPPGIYDDSGRPRFFSDPAIDRLISVVLQLSSEVWVLAERLETIERLAAAKGCVTLDEIRTYSPDPAETAEREAARDRYVQSVLGPLREVRS